jgi:hypothetical protein
MSHAGKKVLSHGRDLIRPSERGLDRLDRQKGYVAQAERRHNPDKTKNNVNIRKNDRKEANLVMSLYCQFQVQAGCYYHFKSLPPGFSCTRRKPAYHLSGGTFPEGCPAAP